MMWTSVASQEEREYISSFLLPIKFTMQAACDYYDEISIENTTTNAINMLSINIPAY
jgi:hypothetical protein